MLPDYRNRERQGYCATPECRKAGKRGRQQRWLSKPENSDYFRGPENIQRVQEWRAEPPGYRRSAPLESVKRCRMNATCQFPGVLGLTERAVDLAELTERDLSQTDELFDAKQGATVRRQVDHKSFEARQRPA